MNRWVSRWAFRCAALLGGAALFLTGCNDDDIDHHPPAGMGCIIVRNYTFSDINVFINGAQTNEADADDDSAYDLRPGVYRVVLDQEDGDRNFRGDIDVLQNRRTIIDVNTDALWFDRYDVFIYFD